MVARVLAIPVIAREADRRDAVRAALILAGVGSVAGYTLVGLSAGAVAILITYTLTSLASTPLMPLAETYALKGLMAHGRVYGPVRLWGSFAFIAGNFAAGFAADAIPARDLIWLMVAASGLVALAAWALPPLATAAPEPNRSPASPQSPLRDPAFIAVLAAASLIQASHAVFYGFSAVQWHAAGLDGTVIAALWALGVAAEIVLFALQARLPPFFEPTVLLMVGAAGACAALAAIAARVVVRSDPSRRVDVSCASRTGSEGSDRAGLPRDRAWSCDGSRDGGIRNPVRRLWQPRLRGDGVSGGRRRRLRIRSAPVAASCGDLSELDNSRLACRSSCVTVRRAG
jgi:hypothetical protein